jgi:hypothetical protein
MVSPAQWTTDWPAHRAVAYLPGSLPMGGVVPRTPVHAFDRPAPALRLQTEKNLRPTRRDIDLGGLLAFVVDEVITGAEADSVVQATERFGYRAEAPGIATPPGMRMNKSVHWVADAEFTAPLFARFAHLMPRALAGEPLFPALSQRINMYKYDAEDVFHRHTDGNWPGYSLSEDRSTMVEWDANVRSGLTMLLYLNGPDDGVVGGNTRLFGLHGDWIDVSPRKGSALFFRHGFEPDSVVHEGCVVQGEVAKYVARINVMYGRQSG